MKSLIVLTITMWSFSFCSESLSQSVLSTSGDHFQKSTGSISFTIGEIAIETLTGSGNILTQGFHQTNLVAVAVSELPETGFKISAHPNPTKDFVLLKVSSQKITGLHYLLFDMKGKLLQDKLLEGTETEISFAELAPATYMIRIIEGDRIIKTLKIVKQ